MSRAIVRGARGRWTTEPVRRGADDLGARPGLSADPLLGYRSVKRVEDAQATKKISREQLEEALSRTKSGTRAAVRSDPALPEPEVVDFFGPRDDTAPQFAHIDPSSLSEAAETAGGAEEDETTPPVEALLTEALPFEAPEAEEAATDEAIAPRAPRAPDTTLRLKPRTAFVVGLVVAALVMFAALVGFIAGRSPHP